MRKFLGLALLGLVSACAQPMIWDKPGANQADFNKDDYSCKKDAIATGGTVYYGWGVTGRAPDQNMYRQCMVAAGYTLHGTGQSAQANAEAKEAIEAIKARQEKLCVDPKFSPIYSKTSCRPDRIGFEQQADTSKISPAAKAIFTEARNEVDGANQEYFDLVRKYGGPVGVKRADLYFATAKVQNDKNNLDLYNGHITWGEYNRRRQQISADFVEASKKVT